MTELRTQIRESFFNPLLHLFPLLTYLLVDQFYNGDMAWKISLPVSVVSLLYVFFIYKRIFVWHLFHIANFLLITLLSFFLNSIVLPVFLHHVSFELLLLTSSLLYIVLRTRFQRFIRKQISGLLPMSNNYHEYSILNWCLFALMLYYCSGNFLAVYLFSHFTGFASFIESSYAVLLVGVIVYEFVHVHIVRVNLAKEEWWPIVNPTGKVVGTVQHLTSLRDQQKYRHPVVRVQIIKDGMLLLQKRSQNTLLFPGLWDSAVSNHLKINDTVDSCVADTVLERYDVDNFKCVFLSNYTLDLRREIHYVFLFVSSQDISGNHNSMFIDQTKWWTLQQIEDNFDSGIFSPNLLAEFQLLKRSGLLEQERCDENCRLKQVITDNLSQKLPVSDF